MNDAQKEGSLRAKVVEMQKMCDGLLEIISDIGIRLGSETKNPIEKSAALSAENLSDGLNALNRAICETKGKALRIQEKI